LINSAIPSSISWVGEVMPVSLPDLASNRNVTALFNKLASAKILPKFMHDFLKTTIGLSSTMIDS
jgi:hypothetical protein